MGEENCCLLGRKPKVFSYVKDGEYFHTICKLRDDIDCFKLNEFFNKVYSIKLEIWDVNFLNGSYTTADLIKTFRLILEEDNCINLKDLCWLIGNNNDNMKSCPVKEVIRYFFEMFDIIDYKFVCLNDFNSFKKEVVDSNDMFYEEVESIFYNSNVMDFLYKENFVKVRKHS